MTPQQQWYVVRTVTAENNRTSPAFNSLKKAQAFAKTEQTSPDALKTIVLRATPPKAPYNGETLGRIYNIHNATTYARIGHALAIYADTDGQE